MRLTVRWFAMASLALAACSGKTESSGGGGAGGSVSAGAGGGVGGICALPADPGPCDAAMPRFWFDAASGKCKQFIYGGCQGNANNFKSPDECVKACSPSTAAACDAVACETGTQCLYASAPEFLATCAAPCGGGTSCPPGQTCSCGASCPGCKNCIQACMPL